MSIQMGYESSNLRVFFFPFMAQGHIIPILDVARLFATRGVESTIVTTPLNADRISESIERTKSTLEIEISVKTIHFPTADVGLPQGCENLDVVNSFQMLLKFFQGSRLLREPLEQLLEEHRPDCLIADMFFPWATDSAAKFNIPRIVFHGISFFSLCAAEMVRLYVPHTTVSSDEKHFVIPYLPDEIKLTRWQLPDYSRGIFENDITKLFEESSQSELRSYGVVVNSFYELEPAYADHYRNFLGRKAWHIGPVSLSNKDTEDKTMSGKRDESDEHECLKWLNSKKPNSVIYVCFGSMPIFPPSQIREIAMGLEASGQEFIWAIKEANVDNLDSGEEYLPKGFPELIKDQGFIIRGWAPQVLILDHEAVGGFVTHCGWNSTLEGICAGVPMVTWPVFSEQFYNEKLVTQVLRTGVGVGVRQWARKVEEIVRNEAIEKAVIRVMVGEEAEDMRSRASTLRKMARNAVEEGGSSYSDLNTLIQELRSR